MKVLEKRLKEEYFRGFEKKNDVRRVGFELEFPLVYGPSHQNSGEMVSAEDVKRLFAELAKDPDYRTIEQGYAVERRVGGFDVPIGTDCGTGQLEIGFPPAKNLPMAESNLRQIIGPVAEAADKLGMYILGYGMQPFALPRRDNVMPKPRYRAMEAFIGENVYMHTLSAANQIHVEVDRHDMIDTMNMLNVLSPQIIALSANSSIALGRDTGFSDYRGTIWDRNEYNVHPQNSRGRTGVVLFKDADHYWNYLTNFTPFLTKRDGVYLMYAETPPSFRSFIERGETGAEVLSNGNGKARIIKIKPTLIDVRLLEGTVWWEARPKSEFGTVESRCAALQPSITEIVAVGALILGLSSNIEGSRDLIKRLGEDKAALADARRDAIKNGLDAKFNSTGEILDIAKVGLRNVGEDIAYLDILYERLERGETPADRSRKHSLENGGREALLKELRLRFD